MQVTITISAETESGEEREFRALCSVSFGSPARGMCGPPEHSSPAESSEVEWISVEDSSGAKLSPDDFEERFDVSLSDYEDDALELAAEESEPADPPDRDDF